MDEQEIGDRMWWTVEGIVEDKRGWWWFGERWRDGGKTR